MPEILEIEMYRRAALAIMGRRIIAVDAPDDWFLKRTDATALQNELQASIVIGLGRIGKLLLVETDSITLGLRFGMTGRLVIDGEPVIPALEYSSKRLEPGWDRFALAFEGGGTLVINDPRRLGGVEPEPDVARLGPDAWTLSADRLVSLAERTGRPCKALLLDQARIAGLGNLLADELCWRTGVHPTTPCDELDPERVRALAAEIAPMLDELYERGGSHLGDHVRARSAGGTCPRDGAPMRHATIGGRSTWWCSTHQGAVRPEH